MSQVSTEFIPTRIAILTVSNRRGEETIPPVTIFATRRRSEPSRCR